MKLTSDDLLVGETFEAFVEALVLAGGLGGSRLSAKGKCVLTVAIKIVIRAGGAIGVAVGLEL